jgi:hypothetical protein
MGLAGLLPFVAAPWYMTHQVGSDFLPILRILFLLNKSVGLNHYDSLEIIKQWPLACHSPDSRITLTQI